MADDSTGWAKGTVSLAVEVASLRADCWGSSSKRTCFRRVRGPREEEAAQDMGCPYRGATEGVRAETLESQTKASRREDSASAIRHVQETVGTIELNQSRGPFGSRAPLCPGLSTFPRKEFNLGTSLVGQWLRTCPLPIQRTRFLVEELRSHVPWGH